MYTSDRERNRLRRHGKVLLWSAAGVAAFGAVYEHFSFGVWSYWMVYAFAPALLAGLWLLELSDGRTLPGRLFTRLLELGVWTATLGALSAGIVEIYGTENRLLIAYPIAAGVLLSAAVVLWILDRSSKKRSRPF